MTWCVRVGLLLFLSGLVYLGLLVTVPGPYESPTSFRKPMLFGFSFAVTLWSCVWIGKGLKPQRGDDLVFRVLPVVCLLEVFLINLQQARGVRSHFNHSTPFDASVTGAMGWLVAVATLILVYLCVRSFLHLDFEPDMQLAARAGLVLLVVACLLGALGTYLGELRLARQQVPELWGRAGPLKFPHGVPIHALQALPLLALFARAIGAPLQRRVQAVALATGAIAAATIYALVQTLEGQGRFEPTALGWLVLAVVALTTTLSARALTMKAQSERRS